MWSKTYSSTARGLTADAIWDVWTDVDQWHTWQDDIEFAKTDGEFKRGSFLRFRPKGGPTINIELTEVTPKSRFVDLTRFLLARMVDSHELIERGEEVEIRTTIVVAGPLALLWRKIVAENIVNGLPLQTDRLIQRARDVAAGAV